VMPAQPASTTTEQRNTALKKNTGETCLLLEAR
jgi:hypothetical protein